MRFRVVTLFPEMVTAALGHGICGRALARGLAEAGTVNPRDFAVDAHKTVDDRPYGGGPGMVLKFQPMQAAIAEARHSLSAAARVVFLSPQGRRFDQDVAREMTTWPGMVLVAGRYEGFDERLLEAEADEEISLGDFVLTGGEVAALAVLDAVIRLLPGALGDECSAVEDSFADGLLDCPHYTRPEEWKGRKVPDVLLSGNHAAIARWRRKQALGRTWDRRPDLIDEPALAREDRQLLEEYRREQQAAQQQQ